jgi:hypothetical protein
MQTIEDFERELLKFTEISAHILSDKDIPNIKELPNTTLSFSWKEMFNAFVECRKKKSQLSQSHVSSDFPILVELSKFLHRNEDAWIYENIPNIFNWSDYVRCYYKLVDIEKRQNPIYTQLGSKNLREICIAICLFYFENHERHDKQDFRAFMSHAPYDLTRPNNWYSHMDYVSYGEALSILWQKEFQNGKLDQKSKNQMSSFKEHFKQYFHLDSKQDIQTVYDLRIPYELYSDSFDQIQKPNLIKPYSLEFCFYYVLQNDLPSRFIYEQKANKEQDLAQSFSLRSSWLLPEMKWFGIIDAQRLITTWDLFYKFTQYEKNYNHLSIVESYSTQNLSWSYSEEEKQASISYFLGVKKVDHSISYRGTLNRFFEAFGEFINLISWGICLTDLISCAYSKILLQDNKSHIEKKVKQEISDYLLDFPLLELNKIHKRFMRIQKNPFQFPQHWPKFENCPTTFEKYLEIWCQSFPIPVSISHLMSRLVQQNRSCDWLISPAPKESFLYDFLMKNTIGRNLKANGFLKWVTKTEWEDLFHAILILKDLKPQTRLGTFVTQIPYKNRYSALETNLTFCEEMCPYFSTGKVPPVFAHLDDQSLELSFIKKLQDTPSSYIYSPEVFML